MQSPVARLAGALAMLALFHWTLQPLAHAPGPARSADIDVEALLQTSRDFYAQRRYDEALPPTLALVERYPAQQVYLERLSHIYHALGRYQDEAATWLRFMDRSPTPWDACPAVADAHAAAGDPGGATAAFERCWAVAPWDPEAGFFLGRARERSGRLDEAESMYRAALDIDPHHGDSEVGLARLELHRKHFETARELATTVVERDPEHADALLIVALAAQRSDDAKTARTYFERTLEVDERYADAHIGLGILEFGQQNVDRARRHFERALELDSARLGELSAWLERTRSAR